MDAVDEAVLEAERGLVGNVDRSRRRQVTIIERETWDRLMADLGTSIAPQKIMQSSKNLCLETAFDCMAWREKV